MTGRVKNVTCVMQELGYLDSALEPDFDRIAARIGRLPVPAELRRDMQDGVQFCRQFSQCIPDSRRDKFMLSGELLRPMFFFRCYKHKKLEACIMKDVRERYQQAAQGQGLEDNLLPNTRAMDLDREAEARGPDGLDEDHMAAAVYEFLYGGDNLDTDSFF
ncbi:Envelope glycoprotein H [Frankliniella fusca]|uniref:Envelope glycoprotein H n=1 Tax=Frankliniella fusca TaxID=407009 RepID=A0AAE1LQR0_9NEOP|nr:Envelope glycoprotein H [Frankliniella fusca]